MSLTVLDYQEIIKRECNVTEDIVVDSTIPLWWNMYAGKSDINLQYWYTRRHVLFYLQGKTRKLVDITVGPDRQLLSQHFKAVTKMLEQTESELRRVDPDYSVGSVAELGSITPNFTLPDTISEQEALWQEGFPSELTSTQTGIITGR